MKTTVVNLRTHKYDVYIGRAGKGKDGYFGNPIKIGVNCIICNRIHRSGGSTIRCFSIYFNRRIQDDEVFRESVKMLKGRRLGCFCSPNPCHGDVIKEYLDEE